MTTAIYPGSFDPVTNGHLDIIRRAAKIADHLIVAVLNNPDKHPLFTVEERVEMAKICLSDLPNVEVISRETLLVDLYRELGASAVVRGLRSESDFRYEAEMNAANTQLQLRGSGDIDVEFISGCGSVSAELQGSGDISLKGRVKQFEMRKRGSGDINSNDLKVGQ